MTTKSEKVEYFTELFRQNYQRSVLFALSYTNNRTAAEDIVSEAMLSMWAKIASDGEIDMPAAYLLGIIRKKILQYFQDKLLRIRLNEQKGQIETRDLEMRLSSLRECEPELLYHADLMQIVERSLGEMSEKTRSIFKLSRDQNLSNANIAQSLGLSVKSVERHITLALKKLRNDIDSYN